MKKFSQLSEGRQALVVSLSMGVAVLAIALASSSSTDCSDGGGHGLLTVELSKLMGFSSERIFTCDLDTPQGRSIVRWLMAGH